MPEEPGGLHSRRSGGWQEGFRDAGPYLGLGMQLALTMVLFTIGGYFLDRWLETMPWLTIGGAVLGMVAVFVHLVRVSRSMPVSRGPRRKANVGDPGGQAGAASRPKWQDAAAYKSPSAAAPQAGAVIPAVVGGSRDFRREDFAGLEREFAKFGEVRGGMLLLTAWDALDLIEAARKEHVPVLGLDTFVLTEAGTRTVDTLDLSAEGTVREGWDEAARFIEDLRDSALRFRVVLGGASQE